MIIIIIFIFIPSEQFRWLNKVKNMREVSHQSQVGNIKLLLSCSDVHYQYAI